MPFKLSDLVDTAKLLDLYDRLPRLKLHEEIKAKTEAKKKQKKYEVTK